MKKYTGPDLASACAEKDAQHSVKTAEVVRRGIQQHSVNFQGRFDQRKTEDAVPQSLLEFVTIIEHGPDIESQCISISDQAIAQLRITSAIQFS